MCFVYTLHKILFIKHLICITDITNCSMYVWFRALTTVFLSKQHEMSWKLLTEDNAKLNYTPEQWFWFSTLVLEYAGFHSNQNYNTVCYRE